MNNNRKLLITAKDIMGYLDCSRPTLDKYMKLPGFPVTNILGRLHAHKDNIDEYFRRATIINQPAEILKEAE